MRRDDKYFHGTRDRWRWIVACGMIPKLDALVAEWHPALRLCIAAFDSGPISPSAEEVAIGWSLRDDVMVSPPLDATLSIPHDDYDEWYIFHNVTTSFGRFERFVNYGGFNLADPREMSATFDPTWERSGLDWLYPIQGRFWSQIDRYDPITYTCSGDNDVVVTKDQQFADKVLDIIRESVT